MHTEVLKALIQNSTLLVVAFLLVSRFSRWRMLGSRWKNWLIQGFAYALCGMLAMLFSVQVLPRVLIDMRTPIIVVAVLTGGPIIGLITVFPLYVYRFIVGGTGMIAGIGIITTAYLFGLLLRAFERKPAGLIFQFAAGIGSAFIYYIWILTLPGGIAGEVLHITLVPLTAASVLSIIAIFMIRKREAAHEEVVQRLREVSDLFEEISLDENIGIVVLDGMEIVYVNSTLLSKYGFKYFDPDNTNLLEIVSPENHGIITSYIEKVSAGEKFHALPMSVSVKGKGVLTFLVHARKLIYRGRDCVLVVSVDITRLVHTEKALQKRVEQLQLALEASGAVLWTADLESDVLMADRELYRLLRYVPDEGPPRFSNVLEAIDMSREIERDFIELRAGKRRSIFGEMSYVGSDGKQRWFNAGARITAEDGDGTPLEITGIIYETTEIKEKELELKEKEIQDLQSQKMETIGRLAGGVAHDFNNLLHVVMGYTEILGKVSGKDPVAAELVKPIMEATNKGRELVRQLLLFSRKKMPELKPLDLPSITGNFIRLLERVLEENITIITDIPKVLPPVMGDAGQIEQVLMNLCINARDAMPEGGRIEIALRDYTCDKSRKLLEGTVEPGEYVILSVRDSGPGIPPENHSMIFEPFYTTKQVDQGTGLGLSTVLGIMESHSGAIQAGNSIEGGFEISLYFPVSSDQQECRREIKEREHGHRSDIHSITVLVAEDDPPVRELTMEGLGAAGIKAVSASNGLEAVEVFMKNPDRIDLLVFDVVMPNMNGPDAYREIREAGFDVPVIFTTGYAGDSLKGLPGKHRLINKPYGISKLVHIIAEELGTSED